MMNFGAIGKPKFPPQRKAASDWPWPQYREALDMLVEERMAAAIAEREACAKVAAISACVSDSPEFIRGYLAAGRKIAADIIARGGEVKA